MALVSRLIRAHLNFAGVNIRHLTARISNVFGDINHNRAGTTCRRNVISFCNGLGNIFSASDQKTVLNDGTRNTHHICFLKGILTNFGQWNLSRDNHQRNRIHIGSRNTCDRIGGAGTRGHQRSAHFASGARKTISSMNRSLLMAN